MESALIIAVPEADEVVGNWRSLYDVSAAEGIPAHITVLYPFLSGNSVDDESNNSLTTLLRNTPAFDFLLDSGGWFGDSLFYLAPNPQGTFVDLTSAVCDLFPQCQPYSGEFDEVIPHLTVAYDGTSAQLREVESDVNNHLPIASHATEVVWMQRESPTFRWTQWRTFPLGR